MKIDLYQVDAFASNVFEGNPAAVCPLPEWIADEVMQQIAMENNLSETAFLVEGNGYYGLRWFTPETEVDLCGHATLATAHVLFDHLGYPKKVIRFRTKSGELNVSRSGDFIVMDFPANLPKEVKQPEGIEEALGAWPLESHKSIDYLFLLENEEHLRSLNPDFGALKKLESRGIIVTARGDATDTDFVSRFFAPALGIDEDPVTGSAHTTLAPYWAEKLGKTEMAARQLSKRGGNVKCKIDGDRIELAGQAQTYLQGTIKVEVE